MAIDTTKVDLSTQNVPQTGKAHGSDKLGKNEFLKILTAQLANQDPTKPQDSNAFVAQLAQFSALEQQQNTNDTLTKMLTMQQSASQTAAVGLVGKDALYKSQEMELGSTGTVAVDATLAADAGNVSIVVKDAEGNTIRTQDFGPQKAGKVSVVWDGKNKNGAKQEPGSYTISMGAVDVNGKSVGVTQETHGRVTGVTFASGTPELLIGNTAIPISDVEKISEISNSK